MENKYSIELDIIISKHINHYLKKNKTNIRSIYKCDNAIKFIFESIKNDNPDLKCELKDIKLFLTEEYMKKLENSKNKKYNKRYNKDNRDI